MTTYVWHDDVGVVPQEVSAYPIPNSHRFVSPLDNTTQTGEYPATRWRFVWLLPPLSGDDAANVRWFLDRLNGLEHRIQARLYGHSQRGNYGGTPLVAGGSQTGTSLNIDGASTSVTNWTRKGDYITVGDKLYPVAADANSDGSGNVTITLAYPLHESPSDNASVEVTNPYAVMMLERPDINRDITTAKVVQPMTIPMIEDLT